MTATRFVNRCQIARIADALRANGKRIVATNGCFDILHTGHTRYLQASRAHGDVLIIGLNSDESVRALKGPTRPVNSAEDRAELLLALRCVDYVTVFNETTACQFLEAVRPHVYTKGGDYSAAQLPEAPVVLGAGGEIVILNLVAGKSTTKTIERLGGPPEAHRSTA